jgi:hypothetical protein
MLLAVRVNLDHFIRDLMEGDPVVWAIVVGVVLFTAFGAWQKYRSRAIQNTPSAG